jgi:hypothetical protein
MQAYAKTLEATSDTAKSQLDKMESASDLQGAELALEGGQLAEDTSAEGALLSGISSVGTNWAKYQAAFKTT